MKASRAYIAGLGTSGVLIASFLLLLTVGSAIVAFRGAPGEANNDGLDRLDVTHSGEASGAARSPLLSADRAGRSARRDGDRDRGGDRGGARRDERGRVARRPGSEPTPREVAGDLGGGTPRGGSSAAGESVIGSGNHTDGGGGLPRIPAQVPPPGVTLSAPSVGGVAEGVGGAVEQTSGGLGETVGQAAPPLQEPVAGAGETVGGAVEETAPVIEETVSGATGTVEGVTEGVTGATGGAPTSPALP